MKVSELSASQTYYNRYRNLTLIVIDYYLGQVSDSIRVDIRDTRFKYR